MSAEQVSAPHFAVDSPDKVRTPAPRALREHSSVGRAPSLQDGCRRFEPCCSHPGMYRFTCTLMLGLFISFSACDWITGLCPSDHCTIDRDCGEDDYICVHNQCVIPCESNAGCPIDSRCGIVQPPEMGVPTLCIDGDGLPGQRCEAETETP